MGLGSALVQKTTVDDSDIQLVFTRVVLAGLGMAALIFFVAPQVSVLFADPLVAEVMRGMAPVFLLQALAVTSLSLLKRELAFKAIQAVQIGSYLAGFLIVGVGAAWLGAGVWSLVAAWIAQSAMAAISLYWLKRHTLRPHLSAKDGSLTHFGIRVLLTNIANWTIENIDNLLVGKLFGSTALGLYSVSYNLVRTPANHLVVSLQTVLFPASARSQNNQRGLQRAYLTVVSGVALIACPLFFGVAVAADTLVSVLFGPAWAAATPVLIPLAMAMALHALMAVAGSVLWGQGMAGTELRIQAVTALLLTLLLLFAGFYSVTAMAWVVFVVYAIRFIGMTYAVLRSLQLTLSELMLALRGGLLATLLTTGLLTIFNAQPIDMVPAVKLLLDILACGLGMALFVVGWPRLALSRELADLARRLPSRSPIPGLSAFLGRVRAAYPVFPVGTS